MIKAVLFDLDGTLIDTARDMARSLNLLREEEQLQPLDYETIRSEVSHGARAMIQLGFNESEGSDTFESLRQRFLDIYVDNLHIDTRLFPEMDHILESLESRNLPWGIVTNKPSWLTLPLLESMQLKHRASTIVCADTAGVSKPSPKPMHDACEEIDIEPRDVMYVGDDQRDVEAAHAAGLPCIILRCGYIRQGHNPDDWGAELVMDSTSELRHWLEQQTNTAAA